MIVVFTGNGKGKTTATLGTALRAFGHGKKTLMIQFIKGPWKSGEDEFVRKLKDQSEKIKTTHERYKIPEQEDPMIGLGGLYGFEIRKRGLGFVGILGDKLPREDHIKAAIEALQEFVEEKNSKKWDMIILDEVNVALSLNLLKVEDVLSAIADFPDEKVLILTGRDAPVEIIEVAHLVTEMKEVKHPFNDGKWAKMGLEF